MPPPHKPMPVNIAHRLSDWVQLPHSITSPTCSIGVHQVQPRKITRYRVALDSGILQSKKSTLCYCLESIMMTKMDPISTPATLLLPPLTHRLF